MHRSAIADPATRRPARLVASPRSPGLSPPLRPLLAPYMSSFGTDADHSIKRTSSSGYDLLVRNTAELRGEILEAARAEFASYGLAGARIDRIARTANASKERLYAHFGDKETLFREVVAADSAEFFRAISLRRKNVP